MSERPPWRNILLTGYYAAGKTAVARELSRRMRRPYVDLEHELRRRSKSRLRVLLPIGAPSSDEDVERHLLADCAYRRETIFELSVDTIRRGEYLHELHDFSFIVFLDPPLPELVKRMESDGRYAELLEGGSGAVERAWTLLHPMLERCDFQLLGAHTPQHSAGLILHSFFT